MLSSPRILFLDLETTPTLAYVWSLYDQNVGLSQIVEPTRVLCFAARWLGEKRIHFHSEWNEGQGEMIKKAWDLLDEADAVVTWNGTSFDQKHLNREFVELGLPPVSPYSTVDLLSETRRNFRFLSNKLNYVGPKLTEEYKVGHEGFSLWTRCMEGDPKAHRVMQKYNKQDVNMMIPLFEKLRPWLKSLPNFNQWSTTEGMVCTKCGSDDYQRRGVRRTQAAIYDQFQCNACKGYFRNRKSTKTVEGRNS